MKIGIITQPLHANYGGLLQNYAMQQVLVRLGHDVYTINKNNIPTVYTAGVYTWIKFQIKQFIKRILRKPTTPSYCEFLQIRQHCIRFVENNIRTTGLFRSQEELQKIIEKYKFNGYVVGSDQVWRPIYSLNIYNDFLDFCKEKKDVKRLAYAASFGVDNWEFDDEQTKECSKLAKLFNAISVREDSGLKLCKEHLGVKATHVLDPTLLLEKEDYIRLVEQNGEKESGGDLFCYILDSNKTIEEAMGNIEKKMSLKSFQVKAKRSSYALKREDAINDFVVPSPTKWIRAFIDAKMVFTDSFHGCVFSIIFNKPFWVIGNKERGNARFDSLLKLFSLEDRRISVDEVGQADLTAPINWDSVNAIKKEWQKKSIAFINKNL